MVTTPTLKDLNGLSASQVCLLMLRTMNTSDMTFMYMLFMESTVADIVQSCKDIIVVDTALECANLTLEEHREFWEYIQNMESFKPGSN